MMIRNVTVDEIEAALRAVNSSEYYRANARYTDGINVIRHRKNGRKDIRVALSVKDSKGIGSRRTWTGRRGPYACWHLSRDFYYALFTFAPDCKIDTAMAKYTSANFDSVYPQTADKNIGSIMQPAYMPELCDCYGSDTDDGMKKFASEMLLLDSTFNV